MNFLPLWTTTIISFASIVYLSPTLTEIFIYDRQAILNGEIWRLLTGHLVHFSFNHLLYNEVGFGIVGLLIESRGYPLFGFLCVLMASVIGVGLFIIEPTLAFYSGLSGLGSGAIVYLALWGLQETPRWRLLCQGVLIVVTAKIGWELGTQTFIFNETIIFIPVPYSHLLGSLTALGLFLKS